MPESVSCDATVSSWTEAERLAELRELGILDSSQDAAYDDLTRVAALVCATPIALVSLVDENRQWFKSEIGLGRSETPIEMSICAHTLVRDDGLLAIPDLTQDPRTAGNPLVTGAPHLRFYAGAVIRTKTGRPLGSLCVIDLKARVEGLTALQSETLLVLARQVGTLIELNRAKGTIAQREAAIAASDRRFEAMAGAMPQMVWTTRPDGYHEFYNDRWYDFTGVPRGSTDGEGWNGMFHPADQERAWIRWRHSLATGAPYEVEYRLRHHSGEYRWTLGRAMPLRDADGRIERWFGTCTDIEDLKRAQNEASKLAAIVAHSKDFVGMIDADGAVLHVNAAGRRLVGLSEGDIAGTAIADYFTPESQATLTDTVLPGLERDGWWEGELAFRHFATGEAIAVLYNVFPVRDDHGALIGYGTVTRDLRERKRAEEARDLLVKELSHRIKNIFAVVGGIAGLSARTDPAAKPFVAAFRERLSALAQAHEYVRPHSPASAPAVKGQTLLGLMRLLMAAYAQDGRERIVIRGDDVPVGDRSATALALIMHEQATNAVKYGGLSSEDGTVTLTGNLDGPRYTLTWAEAGGPAVTAPPTRQGFGTVLAERSVAGQLDGILEHDWAPGGLVMRMTVPAANLAY